MKLKPIICALLMLILLCSRLYGYGTCSDPDRCGIGWEGDDMGVLAYRDGRMFIRARGDITVGFGIYNNPAALKWYNHSGYLPCLVSEFERDGCTVKIMNFGDNVNINGNDYVIAYSRVSVYNHSSTTRTLSASPYGAFTSLSSPGNDVVPGETKHHDYAIAVDKYNAGYSWPSGGDIAGAGSWNDHFNHMKNYWDSRLARIFHGQV